MQERSIIQNLKIELKAEDALRFLGRRGAKLNMDEILGTVNSVANPKFIIKELPCSTDGDRVTVGDCVFCSAELAAAVKDKASVILYAGTAGSEILDCSEIENAGVKSVLTSAMFVWSMNAVYSYLSASLDGEWTSLKPGVVADWPVSANLDICRLLGGIDEIGVSINDAGYLNPIDSNAGFLVTK